MTRTNKALKIFWAITTIVVIMGFLAWATVRTVKYVQLDQGCIQYLKRAADANTVDIAKEELAKAISYAEENNLTEGVVSIIFHQPKNDVGFWYKNLTEAYGELENVPKDASHLEKTNVLMKLRETLLEDNGLVTIPSGISVYPNNVAYFWWGLLSSIGSSILLLKKIWDY